MRTTLEIEKNSESFKSSDRSFGIMFAFLFTSVLGLLHWRDYAIATKATPVLLVLAGASFGVALVRPRLLRRLNQGWMAFSVMLGRIVSPFVLSVLYFVILSPLAVVLRFSGRDVLRLRSKSSESHWRSRTLTGYSLEQFRNQY